MDIGLLWSTHVHIYLCFGCVFPPERKCSSTPLQQCRVEIDFFYWSIMKSRFFLLQMAGEESSGEACDPVQNRIGTSSTLGLVQWLPVTSLFCYVWAFSIGNYKIWLFLSPSISTYICTFFKALVSSLSPSILRFFPPSVRSVPPMLWASSGSTHSPSPSPSPTWSSCWQHRESF